MCSWCCRAAVPHSAGLRDLGSRFLGGICEQSRCGPKPAGIHQDTARAKMAVAILNGYRMLFSLTSLLYINTAVRPINTRDITEFTSRWGKEKPILLHMKHRAALRQLKELRNSFYCHEAMKVSAPCDGRQKPMCHEGISGGSGLGGPPSCPQPTWPAGTVAGGRAALHLLRAAGGWEVVLGVLCPQ